MVEQLTLGDRIKFIRKEKKLTQLIFGEKLNPEVTKSTISRWESNTIIPNNNYLKQIARMGNVSVDYIKTGKIDKSKLLNAISLADVSGFNDVLNDDSFESRLTYDVNARIIETEAREGIRRLTTNHYNKFRELSLHSQSVLRESIKLINLFEKDSADEENNEYSSNLADLLSQINTYTRKHTVKNKNAVNSALNKLLESVKDIDID